jgi:hypothetical protein
MDLEYLPRAPHLDDAGDPTKSSGVMVKDPNLNLELRGRKLGLATPRWHRASDSDASSPRGQALLAQFDYERKFLIKLKK